MMINGHTKGIGRIEMKRSQAREVKRRADAGRWVSRKAENSEKIKKNLFCKKVECLIKDVGRR